ncbi:MAG: hypothetical protein EBS36_07140 [Actinobacteria bacterium]|nr:hypothetical protein [Actinomycetota bacterium]
MKTPILGSAYVARSINAADNRMVNLFPEIVPEGGKEAAFLNRAPGLTLLATVGTGPIRGLWTFNGVGYVVSGLSLYSINSSYTATFLGTVSGTGPVSMADNGTQLFIACNGPSYIYNSLTNVFVQITDPDFPGALTVGYLDGYFVFIQPNTQKLWVTALLEGTSVDPLDFASAEGSPDNLVSMIVDHREVWLYGTNSVEVWYDAGNADFPLQRIQGAYNEIGCAATFSVAKLDNGLFWLGADARGQGIVYRANGYTGQRISTHAIEYAIAQYPIISDAVAYTYQQEGHAFYVLTFPSANATWVYDVSTQAWHERAAFSNGQFLRHRSNCQMAFNSEIVVGDFANGNLYAFDLDVYADNGSPQKWLRSWRALPSGQNNLTRTAHHSLQLDCESGVGINNSGGTDPTYLLTESGLYITTESGDYLVSVAEGEPTVGSDPQVMLRWSDDGGHTWSNEHWAVLGKIGVYQQRVFWRRLGMTLKLRDRVYELSGTDPVKIAIMGAELHLSGTSA